MPTFEALAREAKALVRREKEFFGDSLRMRNGNEHGNAMFMIDQSIDVRHQIFLRVNFWKLQIRALPFESTWN